MSRTRVLCNEEHIVFSISQEGYDSWPAILNSSYEYFLEEGEEIPQLNEYYLPGFVQIKMGV